MKRANRSESKVVKVKRDRQSYEKMDISEVVDRLSADTDNGLSGEEAEKRLEQYGENAVEEEKQNPIKLFFSHFWGPIPWMIELALILASAVQRWEEFGVIFLMLMINGGVSFWHENKASNAIQALREKLALEALVVRDGKQQRIDARQLVPGDVVVLRMGDVVPADAKLLNDQNISIDESSLTGESLPVDKGDADVVYSGTTAKQGEAKAIVIGTGGNTKFARTVELVETAGQTSHFQKAVLRIGYFLMVTVVILVVIIISISLTVRDDDWVDVLIFALGLTVAGIPVALPAVLSVTMSIGANRLARMKAIVARLAAMEEMAGLEVLCADKTGTLTKNQLELQNPVVMDAEDEHDIILAAALTTRSDTDDPIDRAILAALDNEDELQSYDIVGFQPFDPTRKRADAKVRRNGHEFSVSKGAPQAVLDLIATDESKRKKISDKVDELGESGFRSLGVARTDENGKWHYLGILPLLDPPRDDSTEVIRSAQEHNIDIRMVTGDHTAIAKQVAKQLGLEQNIQKASDIFKEDTGEGKENHEEDREISDELLAADGFAEVTPEHKFKIIKQFQANDHIVGMTGDGVNDAPALRQADVGIAVPGATDAARSAAALVLTEQGLGVITHAVEEARRIFWRMTSYATYRIAETIRLVSFVSLSILAFNFYPVTPIMIVLLAILNDIPIMAIAWDKARTPQHPVRWDMGNVLTIATVLGLSGVISSFLLYWFLRVHTGLSSEVIQTLIFLKLLVAGHMTIFLTRNRGWLWEKPLPSLILFIALEATQLVGTLAAVYGWLVEPIGWGYAMAVWGYSIVWMVINNGVKIAVLVIIKRFKNRPVYSE